MLFMQFFCKFEKNLKYIHILKQIEGELRPDQGYIEEFC